MQSKNKKNPSCRGIRKVKNDRQKLLQRILRKNGKKSPNDGKGGLQFLRPVLYYMRIKRFFAKNVKNDGRAVANDFERGIF